MVSCNLGSNFPQYSVLLTFNFKSPFRKCLCRAVNSNPSLVSTRPRAFTIGSYSRRYAELAASPLMNQVNLVGGCEKPPEVQFTRTGSPSWYLGRPPLIFGPSAGSAVLSYNERGEVKRRNKATKPIKLSGTKALLQTFNRS